MARNGPVTTPLATVLNLLHGSMEVRVSWTQIHSLTLHFLPARAWTDDRASLNLNFLIWEMGTIAMLPPRFLVSLLAGDAERILFWRGLRSPYRVSLWLFFCDRKNYAHSTVGKLNSQQVTDPWSPIRL